MPDVLIRDVPKKTLDVLRTRAAARQRSLQQELRLLLEREATWASVDHVAEAKRIRGYIARHYPNQTDSTKLIREDRDTDHGRALPKAIPGGSSATRRSTRRAGAR